jgi:hypothetical protein
VESSAGVVKVTGNFTVTADSLTYTRTNSLSILEAGSMVARGHVRLSQTHPGSDAVTEMSASTISFTPAAPVPQPATGAISGTVTDPSGALVPGVRVTVTNQNTGVFVETLSNGQRGIFCYWTCAWRLCNERRTRRVPNQ